MDENKEVCPTCGSPLTLELSGCLHCNQCGNDSPIITTLYGTPMNPKRREKT
jgi:hypothetical protein